MRPRRAKFGIMPRMKKPIANKLPNGKKQLIVSVNPAPKANDPMVIHFALDDVRAAIAKTNNPDYDPDEVANILERKVATCATSGTFAPDISRSPRRRSSSFTRNAPTSSRTRRGRWISTREPSPMTSIPPSTTWRGSPSWKISSIRGLRSPPRSRATRSFGETKSNVGR